MRRIVCFLVLCLLLSCKKTKLTGDLGVLVGEWEWVGTFYDNGGGGGLYTPSFMGYTIDVEFKEKGKYYWQQSGEKKDCTRLVENNRFTQLGYQHISFHCQKDQSLWVILISNDSIALRFHSSLPYHEEGISYFVRK